MDAGTILKKHTHLTDRKSQLNNFLSAVFANINPSATKA